MEFNGVERIAELFGIMGVLPCIFFGDGFNQCVEMWKGAGFLLAIIVYPFANMLSWVSGFFAPGATNIQMPDQTVLHLMEPN